MGLCPDFLSRPPNWAGVLWVSQGSAGLTSTGLLLPGGSGGLWLCRPLDAENVSTLSVGAVTAALDIFLSEGGEGGWAALLLIDRAPCETWGIRLCLGVSQSLKVFQVSLQESASLGQCSRARAWTAPVGILPQHFGHLAEPRFPCSGRRPQERRPWRRHVIQGAH